MGNCSALLGDVTRARREFAAGGLYVRPLIDEFHARYEDIDKHDRWAIGQTLEYGLYMAILSGNEPVIEAVTMEVRSFSDDFEDEYWPVNAEEYWRACALGCLFQKDDEEACEYIERYLNFDSRQSKLTESVQKSMMDGDKQAIREALRQMAAEHIDIHGDTWPWREELSHAAIAHLFVARRRGVEVWAEELNSEYVPSGFDTYDIGDDLELPSLKHVILSDLAGMG